MGRSLESGLFWQLTGHDGRTGELRQPNNSQDPESAFARFVDYPESADVFPEITEYSAAMNERGFSREGQGSAAES